MPETAENVAEEFHISRQDQDAFAYRSQQRTAAAIKSGALAEEIVPVTISGRKGVPIVVSQDEHPRPDTTLEALAALKPIVKPDGTITAGNASGVNDGACALLLASEQAVKRYGLTPKARVVASAAAGVAPRIMGMGPAPATRKVLALAKLDIADMDVIELNEAFASQALAVLRDLQIPDDAPQVNPNGGAISIGHPSGCQRSPVSHDCRLAIATHRRALRSVHHVHRRRPGYRDGAGARVVGSSTCAMSQLSVASDRTRSKRGWKDSRPPKIERLA